MAIAVSVRPNQSSTTSPRRSLPALAALLALFVAMPWASRLLEAYVAPATAALIGQGAEIALGLALGLWVFALVRGQQRLASRHQVELERLTQVDALTGLGTREACARELDLALNRARRTKEPVSVIYLDVDALGQVNAHHGRATGDRTLRMMGAVLRSSVRFGCDAAYRIGEDEFAVVVVADRDGADAVCRRVDWNFRERSPRNSQLSTGLATWDGRSGPEEMLRQARRALQAGRQTAMVAEMA